MTSYIVYIKNIISIKIFFNKNHIIYITNYISFLFNRIHYYL